MNKNTSLEDIKPYLSQIHMVLVMTVVPGKGGQKLIPETLDKVRELLRNIESKEEPILEKEQSVKEEPKEEEKRHPCGYRYLLSAVFDAHWRCRLRHPLRFGLAGRLADCLRSLSAGHPQPGDLQ